MYYNNMNPIFRTSKISKILTENNNNKKNTIKKVYTIKPINYSSMPVSGPINSELFFIKVTESFLPNLKNLGFNTETHNYFYFVKNRNNDVKSIFSLKENNKYIEEINFIDVDKDNTNFKVAMEKIFSLSITSEYYLTEQTRITKLFLENKFINE